MNKFTNIQLAEIMEHCLVDGEEECCHECPSEDGYLCELASGGYENYTLPKGLVKYVIDALKANSNDDYQRGLNDAWEAARKISLDFDGAPSVDDLKGLFGTAVASNIIRDFDLQTIIERLKNLSLNKLKDVSVGDVVECVDDSKKFVVLRVSSEGSVYLVDRDGFVSWYPPTGFKKTGIHYGSLLHILKMIGGGTDDAE